MMERWSKSKGWLPLRHFSSVVDCYLCHFDIRQAEMHFSWFVDVILSSGGNGQNDGFCTGLEFVDGYLRQARMQLQTVW